MVVHGGKSLWAGRSCPGGPGPEGVCAWYWRVHSANLPRVDSAGSHGPEVSLLPNFKACRTLTTQEQAGKGSCCVRPLTSALTQQVASKREGDGQRSLGTS